MYDKDAPPRPDWRITRFYVDKKHCGEGIARQALEGALDLTGGWPGCHTGAMSGHYAGTWC
jgi:hypothetical protein